MTDKQKWNVGKTKPYEGIFSAHGHTDDISASEQFIQLDLDINLAPVVFVQFYFYTPSDQFKRFELRVVGQSAWLDNVALLDATPSFLETWESGHFPASHERSTPK